MQRRLGRSLPCPFFAYATSKLHHHPALRGRQKKKKRKKRILRWEGLGHSTAPMHRGLGGSQGCIFRAGASTSASISADGESSKILPSHAASHLTAAHPLFLAREGSCSTPPRHHFCLPAAVKNGVRFSQNRWPRLFSLESAQGPPSGEPSSTHIRNGNDQLTSTGAPTGQASDPIKTVACRQPSDSHSAV